MSEDFTVKALSLQVSAAIATVFGNHAGRIEWQMHFIIEIPQKLVISLLVRELCHPMILEAPSAANPIKLLREMPFSWKVFISKAVKIWLVEPFPF